MHGSCGGLIPPQGTKPNQTNMKKYISDSVYIVFDGTSYYGIYGCDVEDLLQEDEDVEIVAGPYTDWPDEKIERLNDSI